MKVGDSRRALVPATTKGGGRLLTWTWGGVGWVSGCCVVAGLKGGRGKSKCVGCGSREEQLDEYCVGGARSSADAPTPRLVQVHKT